VLNVCVYAHIVLVSVCKGVRECICTYVECSCIIVCLCVCTQVCFFLFVHVCVHVFVCMCVYESVRLLVSEWLCVWTCICDPL
jgi:hypothetical protein